MPTEKPRITITMTKDQLERIEDYRYGNKMKNQTQAILSLIDKGMRLLAEEGAQSIKEAPEAELSASEAKGNAHIQLFADVLSRAGLIDENGDLSDTDLEFLQAMLLALKAHFKQRQKGRD